MKKQFLLIAFGFLLQISHVLSAQIGSLEGTIISKKGKIVELHPTSFTGTDFENGTVADMSKQFEEKLGNLKMQGWLVVAKIKFIPTSRQNIEIELLEEKSEITVNGEKVDHFKPGKIIKLEWPAKTDASSKMNIESEK